MKQNKLPFDSNIQKIILKMMLSDATFTRRCMEHLKPRYFDDKYHQWVFETISFLYKTYTTLPSFDIMRNEVIKFVDTERPPYLRILNDISVIEIGRSHEYIADQLTYFAKHQCLMENLEIVQHNYDLNPAAFRFEYMSDLSKKLSQIKFDDNDVFNYDAVDHIIEDAANSSLNRVPLGIPPIDEALLGGISKRMTLTFIGPMNAGKSIILVNVARNFMEFGKKVLFINLEEDIDRLIVRTLSSITGLPRNRLCRPELAPYERELKENALLMMKERLIIKNWFDYSIRVEDLYDYCVENHSTMQFDAVVIDYAGLLKYGGGGKSTQKYDALQEVANVLKSLSRRIEVPVITAMQGNRGAQDKSNKHKVGDDLLRCTDIADCFGFTRPFDTVITVTRSLTDENSNKVKFLLDKSREERKGIAVLCDTNYSASRVMSPELQCQRIYFDTDEGLPGSANDSTNCQI